MTDINYYIPDEDPDELGPVLILTDRWEEECRTVIEKENVVVLRLSSSAGWTDDNIEFVENLKTLKGVEVYGWTVKDLTPLSALTGLESIALQCGFTQSPDFSLFKKLKVMKLFWRPKAGSVFDCKGLVHLNIVNFPNENLEAMDGMKDLTRLQISSRNFRNLSGIDSLESLLILDLAICPKFEDLTNVGKCRNLKALEIEKCKSIYDISSIGELSSLEELKLVDCGKLKSLQSLANCRSLKKINFVGDTNIDDGELEPLLTLPNLSGIWFGDRSHYSHKNNDFVNDTTTKGF